MSLRVLPASVSLPLMLFAACALTFCQPAAAADKPNFVVIFCDDLGWGDLTCYGHPTIATPNLDQMAAQGMRLTQFYVASSVCTPSRSALVTGRYPVRTGMYGNRRVLFPDSVGGLQADELTIAEVLKDAGYATGMVGKWHLGHLPQYLPTEHGFDSYYGIPYSNDMDKVASQAKTGRQVFIDPDYRHFNVPLLAGSGSDVRQIERPVNQNTITRRYTERATEYIRNNAAQPFFLYLAHSLPHVPLFRDEPFVDHSLAGLYGDVIEEIDWSVGQVLETLRNEGIDRQTLVVFTSDNGPWLTFGDQGGSAGPLRNGKGTTFEGGQRVPGIFWMPGTIPAGKTQRGLASTLDLLPTFASMAGTDIDEDVVLDGFDLTAMLTSDAPSPRETFFYYRDSRLMAVRHGRYKAHLITQDSYTPAARTPTKHDPPLLYDLETDIGEKRDVAQQHPDVLKQIAEIIRQHEKNLVVAPSQCDRKP
ncbi:sulfatase [Roseiconus nitratireducens]|uniref:Sulfatase n=1 Tax=Roseiconus nitratireducens TaxID=2605748 RepID=A0A5M6DH51_9BACT|nr:sulfatase [Roseiconus nitratireducens]KAA5544575.1 sulfatase [Roseiconus nitratireducens]